MTTHDNAQAGAPPPGASPPGGSLPGGSELSAALAAIRPPGDPARTAAAAAAADRQGRLTKPPGSLGFLEELSVRLAGIAGQCPPPLPAPAAVAVFAADHGVHAQGVTPWPREVTAQMVANFLAGTAVVNAIAAQAGAEVLVVDVGVAADLPAPGEPASPGGTAPRLLARKVRRGTADLTETAAMSRDEAIQAVEAGIGVARDLVAAGHRCLLTGDMGIANTTASAALVAVFTGADPADVTGRGTGIDDEALARKVGAVRRGLARHRPDPADPLGVLAAVGGLEHAALCGFVLGGASLGIPVLLDGVIACSAALAAAAFSPAAVSFLVAGHRSTEPGASRALAALGLRPVLDLDLRLGEGSGAVLALPVLQAAARVLRDVATFDSAGVSSTVPDAAPGRTAEPAGPPRPPVAPVSAAAAIARVAAQAGRAPARRPAGRVLVLGGARSGKSAVAEGLAAGRDPGGRDPGGSDRGGTVEYVAAGTPPDDRDPEWAARVAAHRARRPAHWPTTETLDLAGVLAADDREPVLIDCLSLWLARVMDEVGAWDDDGAAPDEAAAPGAAAEAALAARVDGLLAAWRATTRDVVAVSNEVGCGVVPATASGRRYRDALGRLNALVAADSDQVWFCTAGLPQRLK